MNQLIKRMALCAITLTTASATMQAQGIFDLAKKAAQTVAGNNATLGSVVGSLIGTADLTQQDVVGTWTYNEPAVAFESESLLTNAGGAVVATSVEQKMATQLKRVGFTSGKASITFKADNTYTCTAAGKTVSGTYEVKKNTIVLKAQGITAATANAKLTGSQLQMSFQTNALLKGINALSSVAGNYSSSLKTLSSVAKNVKGMQMGMRFTKK